MERGNYSLRCQVCGVRETNLTDMDPRPGKINATLHFGPNALVGQVDESVVLGYYIYLADSCGRKQGQPLRYVPVAGVDVADPSCCQYDRYTVPIEVPRFDPNATKAVSVMIVPNTTVGELTAGFTTEPLTDWVNKAAADAQKLTPMRVVSGACRVGAWLRAGSLLASMAAILGA